MAVKYTNKVPNTTVTYTENGKDVTLSVSTNSGFLFDGAIIAYYWDGNMKSKTVNLTVNEAGNLATGLCLNVYNGLTIQGATKSDSALSIVNEIPDTEASFVYDGVTATFTVTGYSYTNYIFVNTKVNYTNKAGEQVNLPMTIDGQTCTAIVTDIDDTQPATLTGRYERACLITNNLTLCHPLEPMPPYIMAGDTLTVTIQANEGTEFNADDNAPSIGYHDVDGIISTRLFTVSEDKHTATITVLADDLDLQSGLTFAGGAVPKQVVGANYGAINVYRVTLDELEQFAKVRFFKEVGYGDTTSENIDLGKWVNRIKRIFTDVPVASDDVIKCGNYSTGVVCKAPAVETVTLNFGSVEIPAPNGNATDYDSEIKVFLPCSGFVSLPNDYAGLSVTLTYIINVITGDGIAKLSHNDNVFQTAEVKACSDVIYKLAETVVGGDTWDGIGLQGYEPYVYVKTFASLNNIGRNSDSVRGRIGDFSGFNVFGDVSVISTDKMLTTEQETIYRTLRSGVYID